MFGNAMLSGLADAAGAPRQAAAATASGATAASATATTTAATTTAAATASAPRHLNAASDVFLVEQVERCEADVGDFFFAERDGMGRRIVRNLRHVRRRHGRCGRTSHQ